MSTNDIDRISALERRVDNLEATPIPTSSDETLLRFFIAAMQGDWADGYRRASGVAYGEVANEYLSAARAALAVWEEREK